MIHRLRVLRVLLVLLFALPWASAQASLEARGIQSAAPALAASILGAPSAPACPADAATGTPRLLYAGATAGAYGEELPIRALLTDGLGVPRSGKVLRFQLGGQSLSATTDANGVASTQLRITVDPGSVPLTVLWVGDASLPGATTQATIQIAREATRVRVTGSTFLDTATARMSAALLEPDGTPISNRALTFELGGATASASTDARGVAAAVLALQPSQAGHAELKVSFAGDIQYAPSSVSQPVWVYQRTNFVVWGGNPGGLQRGQRVNFWGHSWESQVTGGDYAAHADFKGFADIVTAEGLCQASARTAGAPRLDPSCWTTKPGNSFPPPTIAPYIGVLVSNAIAKSGSTLYGNISGLALVQVDATPPYGPDPGKPGYGVVVAFIRGGPVPALQLSQTQPAAILPGQRFTIALEVQNTGASAASGVTISERFDHGATPEQGTQTVGALGPGASARLTFEETAPPITPRGANESAPDYVARLGALDGTLLGGLGTATYTDAAGDGFSPADAFASTSVRLPNLDVSVSAPGCVTPGERITYTVAARNLGGAPAAAANADVEFPDHTHGAATLPAIAPGASATATVTWEVPVLPAKEASESNADYVARLRAADGKVLEAKASLRWTDEAGTSYGAVEQSVRSLERLPALAVAVQPPPALLPGQGTQLTFTVTDLGSGPARSSVLAVTPPEGAASQATLEELAPGATATLQVPVVAPAQAADQAPLAFAYGLTWRDLLSNGYGPLRDTASMVVVRPVLEAKLLGQAVVGPGETASFKLRLTNSGHAAAVTVTPAVALPDGTTAYPAVTGGLAPGASTEVPVTWRVPVPAPRGAAESDDEYLARLHALDGAALSLTAAVAWTDANGNAYLGAPPALAVTERLPIVTVAAQAPREVLPGQPARLTFTLRNVGSVATPSAAVHVTLPSGAAAGAATSALAPGATATLQLDAGSGGDTAKQPDESDEAYLSRLVALDGGPVSFPYSVDWKSAVGDVYGALRGAAQTRRVAPVLGLMFEAPAGAAPGDVVPFSTTVTNSGHAGAVGGSVAVQLPDGSAVNLALPATLAPGASATVVAPFPVPTLARRGSDETQEAYLARLQAQDRKRLESLARLAWRDSAANAYGELSARAAATEQIAILGLTASPLPALLPGQPAPVVFTVKNTGSGNADAVALAMVAPNGDRVVEPPFPLAPGAVRTVTLTAAAPQAPVRAEGESDDAYLGRLRRLNGTTLAFTYGLDWTEGAASYGTEQGSLSTLMTLPVLAPALSGPESAGAGEPLTYTVSLKNEGHAPAATVAFSVQLPDGSSVPGTSAELPAGGSWTGTVHSAVPSPGPRRASEATNDYVQRLQELDGAQLRALAPLTYTDAAGNTYGPLLAQALTRERLPIVMAAPAGALPSLLPGQQAPVPFTVVNGGSAEARETVIKAVSAATDTSAPLVLPAGGSATVNLKVGAPTLAARGASETSQAYQSRLAQAEGGRVHVDSEARWSDAAGDAYGPDTAVLGLPMQLPRLSLTLSAPATASSGDTLTYTVRCTNLGRAPASAVSLSLARPDGTPLPLTLPATVLAPGESVTASATQRLPAAQPGGPYKVVATTTWRDGLSSSYGPIDASATTQVTYLNQPPAVAAGPAQTVPLGATVSLAGSVTDDGLPAPLSIDWLPASGPGHVIFADAHQPQTTAQFDALGTYVLRLHATDSQLSSSAEVSITVVPPPGSGTTFTPGDGQGSTINLISTGNQIQLDNTTRPFNFIWIAVSSKGTAVKIDTETGKVLGEYWTSPNGQPKNPSRTTVDKNGNVWVTNRDGHSLTRIGLKENGQCVDRNGNGIIDTSTGANDLRAWTNASGADTNGGVSTAQDECIINYTLVSSWGTRHVAVDSNNDVWVSGTSGQHFDLLDGRTGQIKRHENTVGYGGYGGLIDANGVIWSARPLLRWDTALPLVGQSGGNWTGYPYDSYGLCRDSHGNVWNTALEGGAIRKYSPGGVLLGTYGHGYYYAQGCVADRNDDIWVAHVLWGEPTVGHIKNDGTYVGKVSVGSGVTGVALDAKGKIWATGHDAMRAYRIDPNAGPLGADGKTRVGAVDLTTENLGGNLYNYSDMTGSTLLGAPPSGTWAAVYDSGAAGSAWGHVGWSSQVCGDGALNVTAASSADGVNFGPPVPVSNYGTFSVAAGRYLKVNVAFLRSSKGESPSLYNVSIGTRERTLSAPANQPPAVSAGPNRATTYPTPARVTGSACDDGLPGGLLALTWTQVSGPGTATFDAPSKEASNVSFSAPGTYVLRLTASDGALSASSDVTLTVLPPNNPPQVAAGASQTVVLPAAVSLAGVVSDDGLPAGSSITAAWSKVSGPGAVTFSAPVQAVTNASFGAAGTYVLRLTASDSALSGSADVVITVNPAPPVNQSPVVSAGPSQSVALGQSVTLSGSVRDDGLPASAPVTSSWSLVSGPGPVSFTNAASPSTAATFPAVGTYVLQLTASDTALSGSSQTIVSVGAPAPANAPPVVSAGTNLGAVQGTPVALGGSVSDDGLPAGAALTIDWSKVSGPGAVTFANAASPSTTATFSATGTYVLRLRANDTGFISWSDVTVVVSAPGSTNRAPVVNAGLSRSLTLPTRTLALSGTYTDDSQPAGAAYTVGWSQVSGPSAVSFSPANQLNTTATFGAAGSYVLRLSVSDSQLTGSADVVITVNAQPGTNQAPAVMVGPNQTVTLPVNGVTLSGTVTDDGLPSGSVLVQWAQISGPAAAPLSGSGTSVTAAVSQAGSYAFRLTANDGVLSSSAVVYVTALPDPTNAPPVVSAGAALTVPLGLPAALSGSVRDDGRPAGAALSVAWSKVSGPGNVTFAQLGAAATSASFGAPGAYVLRLTASDTLATASAEVNVTVLQVNQAPVVSAGPNQTLTYPQATATLGGAMTDDGLPAGAALSSRWSVVSGPGQVTFAHADRLATTATFAFPGSYVLRLTASDTEKTASADVGVVVGGPAGPLPTVELVAGLDGSSITAPTPITGSVSNGAWRVEYAPGDDSAPEQPWTVIASGTSAVSKGTIATLDPTRMLNGTYTVRLTSSSATGETASSASVTVKGKMKVGAFTLSYTDLNIGLAGLPIQVLRTYDSRDKRQGDFGVGWQLALRNIRVQQSAVPGRYWSQTQSGRLIPRFCLASTRAHTLSFTLPNGRVYTFVAAPSPSCQLLYPIEFASVVYSPMDGSKASLVPLDQGGDMFVLPDGSGGLELVDDELEPFNPTRFQLTTEYGTVYVVDRNGGVQSVTDPNGNQLTVTPSGILHSSGKSISFVRDAAGRITKILDPAGNALQYQYDASGDLVRFADREGNASTYGYDGDHDLLTVTDPRGVQPVRNDYDDNGRLVSITDAAGHPRTYTHDLDAQTDVVTDFLGNPTVLRYDGFGNIIARTDPLGATTRFAYDGRGNKLSETDATGAVRQFGYDANDNRITETDALGNVTRRTYDDQHNELTTTDALGQVTTRAYDKRNRLTSITDPLGKTRTYTYDLQGLVLSETDPLGNTVRFEYDADGRVMRQTDGQGNQSTYTYDGDGNVLSESKTITTASGLRTLTTAYEYDKNGRRTAVTYPDGSRELTTYNAVGLPATTTDARGQVTTFEYDELERVIKTTYADGTTETATYDANGRQLSVTDRVGQTTQYAYDAAGRRIRTTFPDGSSRTVAYDAVGRRVSETDELGRVTQYEYDAAGRRTAVTNALGEVTRFAYDAAGRRVSVTLPDGKAIRTDYDALGHATKVTYPDGSVETTEYDAGGEAVTRKDRAGTATRFTYDAGGRPKTTVDALGGTTGVEYDERGRRVTLTDASGHVTHFTYDDRGRRTSRTLPSGKTETFAYDAAGNVVSHTDFTGRATTFQYDGAGQLTARLPATGLGEQPVTFTYDAVGRRTSMTDAFGTTQYQYDARGRLLSKATPFGTLTYTYDAAGNVKSLRTDDPAGAAVDYAYDALNRLVSVTDRSAGGGTTGYSYDAAGNLAGYTYPNGVKTELAYDTANQLRSITIGGAQPLLRYDYTRGAAGNTLSVTELSGRTVSWSYDALARLTGEQIAGSATPDTNGTLAYTYDATGNRLSLASTVGAVPPATYSYDDDRLTAETYDANGNAIASGGHSYAYDSQNRLIGIDAGQTTYGYDGDGRRVIENTGGTPVAFLIDDHNPTGQPQVVEERVGGKAQRVFTYGPQRISQRDGSGVHYYAYDAHSGVRALLGADGAITDTYTYDAFGNLLNRTGSTPNRYLYRGEGFDPSLRLSYNRARWLLPRTGRFLEPDPHEPRMFEPRSFHRYLYASANPVDRVDPAGTEDFSIAGLGEAEAVEGILAEAEMASSETALELRAAFAGEDAAAVGRAFNQFGQIAENAAERVIQGVIGEGEGAVATIAENPVVNQAGGVGSKLDWLLKAKDGVQQLLLEVKYTLPSRAGPALTRLIAQVQNGLAVAGPNGRVVVWSLWGGSSAALEEALGAEAFSQVVVLEGPSQLWVYLQEFFYAGL